MRRFALLLSVLALVAAANRVLGEVGPATQIIPGHGPLAAKADLAAFRDMLVGVRANVTALIATGKSLEEVLAAKPTAAFDEVWGKGFFNPETFTRLVYSLLSKKS